MRETSSRGWKALGQLSHEGPEMIKDYAKSVPNYPIVCPICRKVVPMLVLSNAGTTLRPARCLACLVFTNSVAAEAAVRGVNNLYVRAVGRAGAAERREEPRRPG